MKASIHLWDGSEESLTHTKYTVTSRSEFEAVTGTHALPLATTLYRSELDYRQHTLLLCDDGLLPDALRGVSDFVLARIRDLDTAGRSIVVDSARGVIDSERQTTTDWYSESFVIPKAAVQCVRLRELFPEGECWYCGDVFQTATYPRIVGQRLIQPPNETYRRGQWMCDECTRRFVDDDDVELLPACTGCGESLPTCVLRVVEPETPPNWYCADCAEKISADTGVAHINTESIRTVE